MQPATKRGILQLGLTGAGTAVAGPIGAKVGSLAGGLLGSLIFQDEQPKDVLKSIYPSLSPLASQTTTELARPTRLMSQIAPPNRSTGFDKAVHAAVPIATSIATQFGKPLPALSILKQPVTPVAREGMMIADDAPTHEEGGVNIEVESGELILSKEQQDYINAAETPEEQARRYNEIVSILRQRPLTDNDIAQEGGVATTNPNSFFGDNTEFNNAINQVIKGIDRANKLGTVSDIAKGLIHTSGLLSEGIKPTAPFVMGSLSAPEIKNYSASLKRDLDNTANLMMSTISRLPQEHRIAGMASLMENYTKGLNDINKHVTEVSNQNAINQAELQNRKTEKQLELDRTNYAKTMAENELEHSRRQALLGGLFGAADAAISRTGQKNMDLATIRMAQESINATKPTELEKFAILFGFPFRGGVFTSGQPATQPATPPTETRGGTIQPNVPNIELTGRVYRTTPQY